MPIRKYKPTSPGRRQMSVQTFDEITTSEPYRPLTETLKKSGGRNNTGEVTMWWRGGGHKRLYRIIDFKRDKKNIPGKVSTIEYDPNRSARIALVTYADGEKRYILQPLGLKVGDTIVSGDAADILPGNALPLQEHPAGHDGPQRRAEAGPRRADGAQRRRRRAGGRQGRRLRLGEDAVRRDSQDPPRSAWRRSARSATSITRTCRSARPAASRWLGKKPHVRGVAMNPVDHPLGGGEGKTSGGRHPVTPWGVPTKGYKTRNRKPSDKFIVQRRPK